MRCFRLWRASHGRPLTVAAFRAVPLKSFVAYVQREGRPNLFVSWERAKRSTATQRLGEVVLRSGHFDAIRFPSNAMRAIGKIGVNLVIAEAAALDPAKVKVAKNDHPDG